MEERGGEEVRKSTSSRPVVLLMGLFFLTGILLFLGHLSGALQPRESSGVYLRETQDRYNYSDAKEDGRRLLEEPGSGDQERGSASSENEMTTRQGKGEEDVDFLGHSGFVKASKEEKYLVNHGCRLERTFTVGGARQ
jgi:hypothetical protein